MLKLTVEAQPDSELSRTTRALAGKIYTTIIYGDDNNRIIPCKQNTCLEPLFKSNDIKKLI
jgi:hypothetical protein